MIPVPLLIACDCHRVPRLDHLAHGAPDHHVPELDGRRVRAHGVHPPTHVRIEREVVIADQQLPVLQRGQLGLDEAEVALDDGAARALGEDDLLRAHHGLARRLSLSLISVSIAWSNSSAP